MHIQATVLKYNITFPNPLRFEFDPWDFRKLLNFIILQICVDSLLASTSGVATYLQLDGNSTQVHVHV